MDSKIDKKNFNRFLSLLSSSPDEAADLYLTLREKLVKIFGWRGCSEVHSHLLADKTIDRIIVKLDNIDNGVENINAYALQVSRFIWLENLRKNREDGVEKVPDVIVEPTFDDDLDTRTSCLRKCILKLSKEDKYIITRYYDVERNNLLKDARKRLAKEINISSNFLKVKASRIRRELEICINKCVETKK